jgi:MFS family permease
MMTAFFVGIGASSIATGLAAGPVGLAVGLTLIGLFASIYHPVGTAMVVQGVTDVGRRLGINGVAGNLGVAAAALTAGALADLIHWRAAFIVPGALAVLTGLAFAVLCEAPPAVLRVQERSGGKADASPQGPRSAAEAARNAALLRVYVVLMLTTLCGGLIFNATLVALPKVFAVRLTGLAGSTFGVAGLVSAVYVFGAMAQIGVGYLLDRYSLRRILMGVAGLQAPFLLLAARANEVALLAVAAAMMLTIFGTIPIHDTLVARNTSEGWRSRIYSLKYLISLGISSLAVPLVSFVYGVTQEFVALFVLFAVLSLLIVAIGSFLPKGDRPPVEGIAPALPAGESAGGGD